MKNHCQKAEELFKKGYNCSQSVVGAYADDLGIDFEILIKLSSTFGGGMGKLREVCGAVTGMFIVAGFLKGYIEPNNDLEKEKVYTLIQNMGHKFENDFGSRICRELLNLETKESSPKPTKRTENFYKERPCINFIKKACEIIDEEIFL